MPRPVKCRKICHFPNTLEFFPADNTEKKTPIVLTVDEYETIRLLDKKGYSQEQCAASMQVARTTVQRIYEIARKKIADALIDGHPLRIEGGDFRICDGQSSNCRFGGCYKQEIYRKYAEEIDEILKHLISHGKGLEMNMAGMKYGLGFPNPHPDVIRRYKELGGEIVTIGADAHRPEHVAFDYEQAGEILAGCGFSYYAEFKGRKPVFRRIVP